MRDNYTYPVIIDENDPEYTNLIFPQFHGETCVEPNENFVGAAQEYLALQIMDHEDDHTPVPEESLPDDFHLGAGQKLDYVNLWMPYHRSKVQEVYVKKTLTIPSWLDVLAKRNKINFSETLTQALKTKMGIS